MSASVTEEAMSIRTDDPAVVDEYVELDGETFFRITQSDALPEFWMSLVGSSDHWMFLSSRGAVTAGRRNADHALFPYGSDDQISNARHTTGPVTALRVHRPAMESPAVWVPFSSNAESIANPSPWNVHTNVYKNPAGTRVVFEEVNNSLGLSFRYSWAFSEKFGFVREARIHNLGDHSVSLEVADGLQNILCHGLTSEFTMRFSNLGNAYKKCELLDEVGLGLYYLSSIPTDRAEPSEGLLATTVFQTGLSEPDVLLSSQQLPSFLRGQPVKPTVDVRGRPAAYITIHAATLMSGESESWQIVADLRQDHADILNLRSRLEQSAARRTDVALEVRESVRQSRDDFVRLVASADGLQLGRKPRRSNRHFSNTVFNVMRGGVPLDNYHFPPSDFANHVAGFNAETYERHQQMLESLAQQPKLAYSDLSDAVHSTGDVHLERLLLEYLPLAFGRRHGDPTRPWNRFSIDLRDADGSTNLNYEGNWRDIFQNWEALAASYPRLLTAMICRFVNATTADGYNPYRLTKGGFEWEEPTPDDPWANIGYWGDHQIIYLLKLLEWSRRYAPEDLPQLLNREAFVHANVPYRIKEFSDIRANNRDTIEFDPELSNRIAERVASVGADGKLLLDENGRTHHVTLVEKLLTLTLAKVANFVPDGGIWLNTQRPEWNDANNALVGNGLSVVTTCYLFRWARFLRDLFDDAAIRGQELVVSEEVLTFFQQTREILANHSPREVMSAEQRSLLTSELSQSGSDYRSKLYGGAPSGRRGSLSAGNVAEFLDLVAEHLKATIVNNRREDGLYHAYNLLRWEEDRLQIDHLYEMLEGQVAILSSGLLSPEETLELLDALRNSPLFREDQQSYLLYPDRALPRFMEKNSIDEEAITDCAILRRILDRDDVSVVYRDTQGTARFDGELKNAADLSAAIATSPELRSMSDDELEELTRVFERTFDHHRFTGRSGTFFAYEGLGSIYWHMVSKLGLAVSESFQQAVVAGANADVLRRLKEQLGQIRNGIGAEKTPEEYGAFPTDPYSHTPENSGVKQPGMTGQVKEDVLARFDELGVRIQDGSLEFDPILFDQDELLSEPESFEYYDIEGLRQTVDVPTGGFAFTFCQVPVIYVPGPEDRVVVTMCDGGEHRIDGNRLDRHLSDAVFNRVGDVKAIACHFSKLTAQMSNL